MGFIFRVSALQVHAIYTICFLSRNTQCTQCTLLPLIRCLAQRIVKLPAVPRANYRPICHSSITIQLLLILLLTLLPVYCVLWEQEADQGSDLWCTDGGIPNTYLNSSSWAAHALCGLFFFSAFYPLLCVRGGRYPSQARKDKWQTCSLSIQNLISVQSACSLVGFLHARVFIFYSKTANAPARSDETRRPLPSCVILSVIFFLSSCKIYSQPARLERMWSAWNEQHLELL